MNKEEMKSYLTEYVREVTEKSKQGGKNQYICPFCNSGTGLNHSGAFTVYPDTNTYHCFACNESGDIFNLYSKINHIKNFKVVIEELEKKYNLSKQSKDYTKFFFMAEQHLHETDYLTNRGLSLKTQKKFHCGYIKNFVYKNNQTTNAIIIPTSNTSFAWRSTTEDLKRKRGTAHIFNSSALNNKYCFVVEGEIDCMSIDECGFSCIGLGSTSNIRKIFDHDTSKTVLILALDNDKCGSIATTSLAKECDEHKLPYIIAPNGTWDIYKDANELLISNKQTLIRNLQTLSEQALALNTDNWFREVLERKTNSDWRNTLKRNPIDNTVKNTLQNLELIFNNDLNYKNKIEFNELIQTRTFKRQDWKDINEKRIKLYLEKEYFLFTSIENIDQICSIIADDHSYHPIKEYFQSVQWDGTHRIATVFSDFLGATDNQYTRSVAIISFVGAVARIFEPGIKFDTCTVFVGEQGVGKSKFLSKIAVDHDWFTDSITSFDGKNFYEGIEGKWIIELSEGTAFKKSAKERCKQVLASQKDIYRKPYGRHPETHKRQCVFFGTTNNYDFLKDETGNRRFYPIDVNIANAIKSINKELDNDYIAQLWAEAVYLYKNNESIYIQDNQILALAEQEQRKHFNESPLQSDIYNFLEILLPSQQEWNNMNLESRRKYIKTAQNGENTEKILGQAGVYKRNRISVKEIACELFGYELNQPVERKFSLEITKALTALNWNRSGKVERIRPYGAVKVFYTS